MPDPFLEREKELMKLNESLNTKMTLDFMKKQQQQQQHQPKPIASNKVKKVNATTAAIAATAKSLKYDQINHAKLGTKGTSKLKTDSCEIIKKPISNTYTSATDAVVEKFTFVEKKHELDMKDIGFNRNSSSIRSNSNCISSNRFTTATDDTHTTCNRAINETTMGGDDVDDDNENKHQINNKNFDHALIETIEKAIDTNVVTNTTTMATTTASHLSLIPANVYRKNISTDGIIK